LINFGEYSINGVNVNQYIHDWSEEITVDGCWNIIFVRAVDDVCAAARPFLFSHLGWINQNQEVMNGSIK
jgi:hypothetical protein